MAIELTNFIENQMCKGGRHIAARVQAAMSLLERLREFPTTKLSDHKKPNSAGLESHEKYGDRVHDRLGLEAINKNHGRRSSDIGGWGQELLDLFAHSGFGSAAADVRAEMIDAAQASLGTIIRNILDQEPLEARPKGRSAEAVIRELLKQAEAKGKSGEVAQYLVGAKLQLRLKKEIPVVGYNKGDRKSRSDTKARTGDF
jgi:hypothetical protein